METYLMEHGVLCVLPLPAGVEKGHEEERPPEDQVRGGDDSKDLN